MNSSGSIRFHYVLRAVILLAFALYIGHLVQQDALHYYVAPKLARWIRLCPVPLSLMALSLGLQAVLGRSSALCDCEHRLPRSLLGSSALYSLFLLPLLLGFLLPDRALGSAAAAKKGLALSYTAVESGTGASFTAATPMRPNLQSWQDSSTGSPSSLYSLRFSQKRWVPLICTNHSSRVRKSLYQASCTVSRRGPVDPATQSAASWSNAVQQMPPPSAFFLHRVHK